jgi:hypothetical protein
VLKENFLKGVPGVLALFAGDMLKASKGELLAFGNT